MTAFDLAVAVGLFAFGCYCWHLVLGHVRRGEWRDLAVWAAGAAYLAALPWIVRGVILAVEWLKSR